MKFSKNIVGSEQKGWPIENLIDIEDLEKFVKSYLEKKLLIKESPGFYKIVNDGFNVKKEQINGIEGYNPSYDIASFLVKLKNEKVLEINYKDEYLLNALNKFGNYVLDYLTNKINIYTEQQNYIQLFRTLKQITLIMKLKNIHVPEIEELLKELVIRFS